MPYAKANGMEPLAFKGMVYHGGFYGTFVWYKCFKYRQTSIEIMSILGIHQ